MIYRYSHPTLRESQRVLAEVTAEAEARAAERAASPPPPPSGLSALQELMLMRSSPQTLPQCRRRTF